MTHKGWTKALTTIGISPGSAFVLVNLEKENQK
jgi:hypothetical protein